MAPEDLLTSHPGPVGTIISTVRRLLRPVLKLFANTDLPLHKQFKINIGVAATLHELMQENAELRAQLATLQAQLRDNEERR